MEGRKAVLAELLGGFDAGALAPLLCRCLWWGPPAAAPSQHALPAPHADSPPWIEPPFFCDYGYNIKLGKGERGFAGGVWHARACAACVRCVPALHALLMVAAKLVFVLGEAGFYCNFNCCFLDCGPITIGDRVLLGPAVQLYPGAGGAGRQQHVPEQPACIAAAAGAPACCHHCRRALPTLPSPPRAPSGAPHRSRGAGGRAGAGARQGHHHRSVGLVPSVGPLLDGRPCHVALMHCHCRRHLPIAAPCHRVCPRQGTMSGLGAAPSFSQA